MVLHSGYWPDWSIKSRCYCSSVSNNNNYNDNDDDNNNNNNNDFIILPQHILSQPSTHIKNAVLQCSHGFEFAQAIRWSEWHIKLGVVGISMRRKERRISNSLLVQVLNNSGPKHELCGTTHFKTNETKKAHYHVSPTSTATFAAGCIDRRYRRRRSDPMI